MSFSSPFPFTLYLTKNENEEIFKDVYITEIFQTPKEFLYSFKEDDNNASFLLALDKKFLVCLKFLGDEDNTLTSFIFNILYYYHSLQKENDSIFKEILTRKIYTNNINIIKDTPFKFKDTQIMEKINIINEFYKKKYNNYNILTANFTIKNTDINEYKTYFELKPRDKNNTKNNIIELFNNLIKNDKTIELAIICLDEINDYNLRENFNPTSFTDIKTKFINSFSTLNKKLSLPSSALSKYEKLFYNKKFIFYVRDENTLNIHSIPSKNDILNISRGQILITHPESIFINFYINKEGILQGYMNSIDKSIIKDFFKNPFIYEIYEESSLYIYEFNITGYFHFDKEGIVQNISDENFNTFINLYKGISENKYIYTNEKLISYYERKNPSKFYFFNHFNINDEIIDFKNKDENNSMKNSYNNTIKYYKSISRLTDDNDEGNEGDDDNVESDSLNSIKTMNSKNIFKNFKKNIKEINFIKFISNTIYFNCNNKVNLEKLKYNVQEVLALYYKHKSEVFAPIKNLLMQHTSRSSIINEKTVYYKTNFKKLFNIKNYALNEVIKESDILSPREGVKENIKEGALALGEYSNYCQCNFQPLLLNNETEALSFKKPYVEINKKFFTCKEHGFSPKYNKSKKFLCCKKKEKNEELIDKKEVLKIVKKNISSALGENKYGDVSDELNDFFNEFLEKNKVFPQSGKPLFLRKGTGLTILEKDVSFNVFVFTSNNILNDYLTTEVSPFYPLYIQNKYDPSKKNKVYFLVNDYYDILVKDDKTIFEQGGKELNFLFEDYYRKFKEIEINENNKENERKKEMSFKEYQILQLSVQLYLFAIISNHLKMKDIKEDTSNGSHIKIIFSNNDYEVENFLYGIVSHSFFHFIFKYSSDFLRETITIFPIINKVILPGYLESDLKQLHLHFDTIYKGFFKDYFKNFAKDIYKLKSKSVNIKIPISVSTFSQNEKVSPSAKQMGTFSQSGKVNLSSPFSSSFSPSPSSLFFYSLKDFENFKNKFLYKDLKLIKNNYIFRSNNPNFIFLPSYHRYNLYFNNINYDDNKTFFNGNLYTESYIVKIFKENDKEESHIKIYHPNTINIDKEDDENFFNIYEFDITFKRLKKIYFQNSSSKNLLYAPFNSIPFISDKKKSFSEFIDFYIKKKKTVFIPFEFVLLNEL